MIIQQDLKPQNILVSLIDIGTCLYSPVIPYMSDLYVYGRKLNATEDSIYIIGYPDLKGVTICDMGVTRIKKVAEATVTS